MCNGEGREGITVLAICMFLMAEWDCYLGMRRFCLLLFSLWMQVIKRDWLGAPSGGSLNKKQRLQRRLHSLIQN